MMEASTSVAANAIFTSYGMDGKERFHVNTLQVFTSSDNSRRFYDYSVGEVRVKNTVH